MLDEEKEVVVSKRSKANKAISQIVITGMMLAIALALKGISNLIPFFNWPLGGSISLAMVPLVLIALLCGPIYGTCSGIFYGVISFLIDGVISWTPNVTAVLLSLLLDYVIGFGCCGLASIFRKAFFKKKVYASSLSMLLVGIVRLFSSFLSGVIVFTTSFNYESETGLSMEWNIAGVSYSLGYNAGYMLPTIALSIVVFVLLMKPLFRVIDYPLFKPLVPNGIEEEKTDSNFESVYPIYYVITYALAILGTIPSLTIYWFGYISLVFGLLLFAYQIYLIVKNKNENPMYFKKINILYLVLTSLIIVISILAIVSPFTYGADIYSNI